LSAKPDGRFIARGIREGVWQRLSTQVRKFGIEDFGEATTLAATGKSGTSLSGWRTDALTNPYEAGLAGRSKLDKGRLVGKRCWRNAAKNQTRKVVGFILKEAGLPKDGDAS